MEKDDELIDLLKRVEMYNNQGRMFSMEELKIALRECSVVWEEIALSILRSRKGDF